MRHAILCSFGVALAVSPLGAQTEIPLELRDLEHPRVTTRPAESMLVVEAKGDPVTVGRDAFGLLFQLYYRSPVTPKRPDQPAPRARWPGEFETPRSEWVGLYALPVPDELVALPDHVAPAGLEATLTTWEYGDVAEILHIGPYDREEPTMKCLKEFIEAEGYAIAGPHEEEYIRGPTMSGPGDPEQYLTILRFQVVPAKGGDQEDMTRQVRETELAFARTMAERDLDAFLSFVAAEAVFIGGGASLRGVDAIRAGWSPFFEGPSAPFSWEPEQIEVLDSGTLALSSGPVRDPAGQLIGTFNSIWRRDGDGSWKVVFDKGCDVCP